MPSFFNWFISAVQFIQVTFVWAVTHSFCTSSVWRTVTRRLRALWYVKVHSHRVKANFSLIFVAVQFEFIWNIIPKLKMWVHYGISILPLLTSSCKDTLMPLSRSLSRQYKRTLAHSDKRSVALTRRLDLKGEKPPLHHHPPVSINLSSQNLHLKRLVTKKTVSSCSYFKSSFTLDESECDVTFNAVNSNYR